MSLENSVKRIHIDGSKVGKTKYIVMINGKQILLTGKSFRYFTILAHSRQNDGGEWVDKERLEPGTNQARYLYNLKRELGWSLVENNKLNGYRLRVNPGIITFNEENMRNYDDFEIRNLFLSQS